MPITAFLKASSKRTNTAAPFNLHPLNGSTLKSKWSVPSWTPALRASHAKPWADCSIDAERLDVFNGFLLSANLDTLLDQFLISFNDSGHIMRSQRLSAHDRYFISKASHPAPHTALPRRSIQSLPGPQFQGTPCRASSRTGNARCRVFGARSRLPTPGWVCHRT